MPRGGGIPRSRAGRGAAVARLAGGEAIRRAGTRTANLARGPEGRRIAVERRHLDAADRIVRVLGTMKGAAMKVGQMLSVLDLGLVPEEHREDFQQKLAALRDSAPRVSFDDMRRVVEKDLGGPLESFFADFEDVPIGSASIGQVYRAKWIDGDGRPRAVAVKVQYPGVATAVRADLKNLSLIMRLVKQVFPGVDVDGLAHEIRSRVGEELDYALEAANQHAVAERFQGHPFIVIPDVVQPLCRTRVLVSEYVEGTAFEELKGAPDEVRDRVGEIVFRFYCGSIYRFGQFGGDPHPGNFLLQPDGRMAFFDFGMFKRMAPESVALELACQRAAADGRAADLHRLMSDAGILLSHERIPAEDVLAYVHDAIGWYLSDQELELTSDIAASAVIESFDPRSKHFAKLRHQNLPADHLLARRTDLSTVAILGQLRAMANWHRIAREWMYGDPPVTELGRLEAEHHG